jgi:hypothetical protein
MMEKHAGSVLQMKYQKDALKIQNSLSGQG